jgi:uncharacterized Tic20 family protein
MTNQYSTGPQTVRISAGTAIKIGFFGSLGALLFSLILSLIGLVIVLILLALGIGGGLLGGLGFN